MTPKISTAARLAVLILTCLDFAGLIPGFHTTSAQSNNPVSACQRINAPGHYVLTADLSGAPLNVSTPAEMLPPYTGERTLEHTCIEIATSDVTLDCQEHKLMGNGDKASDTTAIYMTGNSDVPLSNVNVAGCVITAHQFGLYARYLKGGSIFGNQARHNYGPGFYIVNSSGLAVASNIVEGNDPDGILIIGSENIGVSDNVAFYNRMRGITFEGCGGCVVSQNESYGQGVLGFAVYGSMNMVLENNTAYDNRYHGFAILHDAGSATFTGNESYNNDGAGFFLQGTQNNHLADNLSRDNGLDGIALLDNAQPNTVKGNILRDNAGYGAFSLEPIDNAVFASNSFSGNMLGDIGINPGDSFDWCHYTGFGPEGPCDPVFEGGPNLKDTEEEAESEQISSGSATSEAVTIQDVHVVGDPVYYPSFGDLWMSTWADDDRLFFSWGDGAGTDYGYPLGYPAYQSSDPITPAPCSEGDLFPCELWCNMNTCDGIQSYPPALLVDTGVTAIEGDVPHLEDAEIVSLDIPTGDPFILQNPGGSIDIDMTDRSDKPSSLLFYNGRLYFAGHSPAGDAVTYGYLAYSDDYGQTWTEVPNSPWGETSNFRVLMFVNMGQSYALNHDGYVYALGIGLEAAWDARSVYLARVPTSSIADYSAYEYFSGINGDVPQWSSDQSDATPLDTLSTVAQGSAIYHEGTGQYLFITATTDYTPVPNQPFGFGGLFAAPQPWGPWTQVATLCFAPECDDGSYDPMWTERDLMQEGGEPGKYIPGLITKGVGPNSVYFSIAGGSTHYQLQIGKLEFDTSSASNASQTMATPTEGVHIVAAEVVEDELVTFPRFGDLWMNTWADNDMVYMSFGDGTAGDCFPACESQEACLPPDPNDSLWCATFNCNQACVERCLITDAGLLELSGDVPYFSGCDTSLSCLVSVHVPSQSTGWVCDPSSRDDKPSSLLALDGKIVWSGHVWSHTDEGERVTYGYLAWSDDNGRTWTEVPDSPWHDDAERFVVMMFINMGQGYELNTDGYVYALGIGGEAGWGNQVGYDQFGEVYLARVPRADILSYSSYEYFTGMSEDAPTWSPIPTEAVPLEGIRSSMQGSAIYHPGVQQYIYLTSPPGQLYVAAQPWGPWRQIADDLFPGALLEPRYGEYGYIPGILSKGTEPDAFWFTITGPYETKYNLRIGKIRFLMK